MIYTYKIIFDFIDLDCMKIHDLSLNLNSTRGNGEGMYLHSLH